MPTYVFKYERLIAVCHSMPCLKWASLRNNNLTDISKLSQYSSLEEHCLENNEIESLDSLSSLRSLVKLDASNNLVATIEHASEFKSLTLLSLENNRISNLKPFAEIETLLEFCKCQLLGVPAKYTNPSRYRKQ